MPNPDESLLRTIDAFGVQRQSIIDRVVASVAALFVPFTDWTMPAAITSVADATGVRVAAGQRVMAGLTDAFMSRSTSLIRGSAVSPVGVGPEMSGVLRDDVNLWTEVYSRLPAEYRWQIALGKSKDDALSIMLDRAHEMVAEDLGLAHRDQASKFVKTRGIAHFRRVIRGENTCGLCVAAADRIYSRGDLLPIHSRCRCTVMEIPASGDPGRDINDAEISGAYKQAVEVAGGTNRKVLKRVRFEVVQHGELGPQLRVKGQMFRGPAEVARSTGKPAAQDSGFWTKPNIERQLEMARNAPNREWGAKQVARYQKWLDEN